MKSNLLPGVFVTFEGTEGAGKSTLIRNLADRLSSRFSRETVVTREPGGNALAEEIRKILLSQNMDPMTELLLYEAARSEHLMQTILPALKRGAIVLCDRYADSSLAYQAHARGLPWKEVKTLNRLATRGVFPEMSILMDIDVEKGLARAQDGNRFEAEGVAFQKKVRAGFLKSRKEEPQRWFVIRIKSQTPDELGAIVEKEFERRFVKRLKKRG